MITLHLFDGTIHKFNLKEPAKEKRMRAAWYSMRNDKKYIDKKLKITTEHEVLTIKINDIRQCDYEDIKIVRGFVNEKFEGEEPLGPGEGKTRKERNDPLYRIIETLEDEKDKNLKTFLSALRDEGVEPDVTSEVFRSACEAVKNGPYWKIPYYVNLCKNGRKEEKGVNYYG